MEVSAVTPPSLPAHHLGPHLQGNQQREAEMVSISRFLPQRGYPKSQGDLALLPSVTVPMGSTWLKATKQLLFVELGGEHRAQHKLCTTEKGRWQHIHIKADEADENHYEMAVSASLFVNKARCRSKAGASTRGC